MSDVMSRLSDEELAELGALADGTLPEERRAEVEARVAASPELSELVERQRRSLAATRMLADEPVPESLQAAVEAGRPAPRRKRLAPRLAAVGALAATVAVVAAVLLNGGPGAPTVADAARLARQAPTAPPPPSAGGARTALGLDVDGVAFPDLARSYGWQAVGTRHGRVDGRAAAVVFYRKDGRRLSYVIVAGDGLARPSAPRLVRGGVVYQTFRSNGVLAVTWRRGGHTCVLLGPAPRDQLLALSSYQTS